MFFYPDTDTLRLCSFLLTTAFSAVFLLLWLGRRREPFLLHWAASAALYAALLLAFGAFEQSPTPLAGAVLHALLACSNMLLVTGARRLEGLVAFEPSLLLPVALCFFGYGLPFWLRGTALALPVPEAARIMGTLGLLVSVTSVGLLLLRGQQAWRGRRIAGLAVLGYVPGYLIGIAMQLLGTAELHPVALVPLLSDQVLLAILYLGLLSMPGERAEAELREAVQRDPLTGAWNRAGMQAQQPAMMAAGGAVIIIDIDHFKAINDRHGHAAGDAVLSSFAAHMAALALEQAGRLVRLGGDEFAVLMPGATREDAERLGRRMHAVALAGIEGLPPYTISLGLEMLRPGDTTLADAMGRADERLYQAKTQGRNQLAG